MLLALDRPRFVTTSGLGRDWVASPCVTARRTARRASRPPSSAHRGILGRARLHCPVSGAGGAGQRREATPPRPGPCLPAGAWTARRRPGRQYRRPGEPTAAARRSHSGSTRCAYCQREPPLSYLTDLAPRRDPSAARLEHVHSQGAGMLQPARADAVGLHQRPATVTYLRVRCAPTRAPG